MNDVRSEVVSPACSDDEDLGRGAIPFSIEAYVATRSDAPDACKVLFAQPLPAGLWTPVAGSLAALVGLGPCPFGADLLLRRDDVGISAIIAGHEWSVMVAAGDAWVDVACPSEAIAMALVGKSVRTLIDLPFLSPTLTVCGSASLNAYRRFHCREGEQVT